jgi:uridine kinase
LSRGKAVYYRRYDCKAQSIGPAVEIAPKALNIVEGAYSMHPALADYYDLSVFLRISPELQHNRIEQRNDPAVQERFFHTWIPLENRYFSATDTPGRCEMILEVES